MEEDLPEDLLWDTTGLRECVAAVSNHTQRTSDDRKHLVVNDA